MPPKIKTTTSAASPTGQLQGQKKDKDPELDIDANKVVSFGALKTYMDSVIKQVNSNTDARFEKLLDDFNGQKRDISTVQKSVKAIATTVAGNNCLTQER